MVTNWLTYRGLAVELDTLLRDARVEAAYTQRKQELTIELSKGEEIIALQCSVEAGQARLLPRMQHARARRNSLDVLGDLTGRVLRDVTVAADDRVLRLRFEDDWVLYAVLFTQRANIALYDVDGTLVDTFRRHALPIDPTRLVYDNALRLPSCEEFHAVFLGGAGLNALDALRAVRPWLSGTLAVELLHRAEIPLLANVELFSTADVDRVCDTVRQLGAELTQGGCHVYFEDTWPRAFSLTRLHHLNGGSEAHYAGIAEGLLDFSRRGWVTRDVEGLRSRILDAARKETERVERSLERLSSETQLRRAAAEQEKFGNLLMIHLYDQPTQPNCMVVPDVFTDPRLVVSIPLKPMTTVLENAQRYFDKARQTRASIPYVVERKALLESTHARLSALMDAATEARDSKTLHSVLGEHESLLRRLRLTPKGERDDAPFPFRRFTVVGGFEVWAGRNSANNDELTVRYARPNDIWFHARGVGGSHVVLRVGSAAGEPSKEAIRMAASIAAYYSKHRNARNVPVAYTEKKYVRKPKGAAPGSVIMEREKVIMVQPLLPEGATEE